MVSPGVALLVLALAAWRTYSLLADDEILDGPRGWLTVTKEGEVRERLVDFIACPRCFGFWVALSWALAYAVSQEVTFWAALPFALSGALVLIDRLDR